MSALTFVRSHHRAPIAPVFSVAPDRDRGPLIGRPFALRAADGSVVDYYRSEMLADCHCSALNRGRAEIHPHRVIGCRVEVLGYIPRV